MDATTILFTDVGRAFLIHQVENILKILLLLLLLLHHLPAQNEMLMNVRPVAVRWKTDSVAKELENVYSVPGASPRTALRGTGLPTQHPEYLLPAKRNIFLANWAPAVHKKRKTTKDFGIGALEDGSIDCPSSNESPKGTPIPHSHSTFASTRVATLMRCGNWAQARPV